MGYNNNSDKRNIAILSSGQAFLPISLANKVKQEGHECTPLKADKLNLHSYKGKISALVIFADDAVVGDYSTMVMIKDASIEDDIPVFLIGAALELAKAEEVLGAGTIKGTFMRPINVNEVLEAILRYLEFYQNNERKSILVVDDSGPILRNVRNMFANKYQVMVASSATMAIKSITLNRPDLILLDYNMPIVDGKLFYEMLKAEADFSTIPIMFLTSMSDPDTATEIMNLHPVGYLLKSMQASEIVNAVDTYFAGKKAF